MKNKKAMLWGFAFLGVFLLSQDYLFAEWTNEPVFLGFPIWVGWFVFVHILFIFIFYWFSKKHWK